MKNPSVAQETQEIVEIIYTSDVIFESNSTTMRPTAHAEVGRIANIIIDFPEMTVDVEVSSEANGLQAHSQKLQAGRVLAVKNALFRQGIDSRRVRASAYGTSQTVCFGDTTSFKVMAPAIPHVERAQIN